jgi:hypothetical protein
VHCAVPLAAVGAGPTPRFWLDVLVNEMSPDRERRRGQLVLSGGLGEYVYLRGDRHAAARLLPFTLASSRDSSAL